MMWTDEQIKELAQKYVYTDTFENRIVGELTKVRTMYEDRIAELELRVAYIEELENDIGMLTGDITELEVDAMEPNV